MSDIYKTTIFGFFDHVIFISNGGESKAELTYTPSHHDPYNARSDIEGYVDEHATVTYTEGEDIWKFESRQRYNSRSDVIRQLHKFLKRREEIEEEIKQAQSKAAKAREELQSLIEEQKKLF